MSGNSSHSRAFFLELVINLVLFMLCAAVCLQVFARAFAKSDESSVLAQATLRAQSIAEAFKASGGDLGFVMDTVGGEATAEGLVLYYDDGWALTSAESAVYTVDCRVDLGSAPASAEITASKGGERIFGITAKKYLAEVRSDG
ncbi:MAG: hypothetical protein LBH39_07145 [Clostridiales Family XIII bacterium]|jgi:hypothetical protein|nr:hypothetical protein [Clostridiales Family XIII bacterium]